MSTKIPYEDPDEFVGYLLHHVNFANNAFHFLSHTFFGKRDYDKYPHPECSPSHVFEDLIYHSVRDAMVLSLSRLMDRPLVSGQSNASFPYALQLLDSKSFNDAEIVSRIQIKTLNPDAEPTPEQLHVERSVVQSAIEYANTEFLDLQSKYSVLKI